MMMVTMIIMAATQATTGIGAPAPETRCMRDGMRTYVGRPYDETARRELGGLVGRNRIRWIAPGGAVTQDWVPDRLNVEVDADGTIRRLYCG